MPPESDFKRRLSHDESAGLGFGLAAFLFWGFTPFYFRALGDIGAVEIVAHRIVWCVVFLLAVLTLARQWPAVVGALADRRVFATLFVSATLVSINWGTYIYSIVSDQLVASSLGYFLSPLVSVFLGFAVLRERLSAIQWLAVALAGGAVVSRALAYGSLPWIALTIAVTFGLYGLVRKTVRASSAVALFTECLLLTPFSLAWLVWLDAQDAGAFASRSLGFDVLLALAGVVTGVPLLLYAASVRRIKLATLGLISYIAPLSYLIIAVWAFGEPFGTVEMLTFGLLWTGLVLYTGEIWRTRTV